MTNLGEIKKWVENPELCKLLNTLSKKRTLLILICVYTDIHTFSEIMKTLPEINTSILTSRLNELIKEGFITKSSKWQKISKPEYNLTKRWKEVVKWVEAWNKWVTSYCLKKNINLKNIN